MMPKKVAIAALIIQLLAGNPAKSQEQEKKCHPLPSLDDYSLDYRGPLNWDEGTGVLMEIYKDSRGNHIDFYYVNGILYACSKLSNPRNLKEDSTIIRENLNRDCFSRKINAYTDTGLNFSDFKK